jgi:tRNA threonylcarbamoyladenosine modification (KEOPS) complex  Pcc1 subunit
VLSLTQNLVFRHANAMILGQDGKQRAALTPLPLMEHFWSELNNCIYMFKLRDWQRARPLYENLRKVPSEIFSNLTPDFLRRFFTAFSPVNFLVSPFVRKGLLTQFMRLAREMWTDEHPFAQLIRQLQLDINSREVSEKGLSCLRESVLSELPNVEHQRPSVQFEIDLSIITLQRRSKDFDAAARSASALLMCSKEHFGTGSPEARDAAEQLAHIYMDTQKLKEAKILCQERVGRLTWPRDGWMEYEYNDKRAVRAMEDFAEIERKLDQPQNCMPWLKAAAFCAVNIKRPNIVILHIVDKVMESARMCGEGEEALEWRAKFAHHVWKNQDVDF